MPNELMQHTLKTGGLPATDYEPIDPKAERKLLQKLDLVIWPVFFVIYMMSFLDRINISNARIQGMAAELDMLYTGMLSYTGFRHREIFSTRRPSSTQPLKQED